MSISPYSRKERNAAHVETRYSVVLTTFVATVVTMSMISVVRSILGDGVTVVHLVISSVTVLVPNCVLVVVMEVVPADAAVAAHAHFWILITGCNRAASADRF
jgi:hypothetical protein